METAAATRAEGFKGQPPEMVELYRPALQALREAFAKAGPIGRRLSLMRSTPLSSVVADQSPGL
jgi:hypothetical protein